MTPLNFASMPTYDIMICCSQFVKTQKYIRSAVIINWFILKGLLNGFACLTTISASSRLKEIGLSGSSSALTVPMNFFIEFAGYPARLRSAFVLIALQATFMLLHQPANLLVDDASGHVHGAAVLTEKQARY